MEEYGLDEWTLMSINDENLLMEELGINKLQAKALMKVIADSGNGNSNNEQENSSQQLEQNTSRQATSNVDNIGEELLRNNTNDNGNQTSDTHQPSSSTSTNIASAPNSSEGLFIEMGKSDLLIM